MTECKLSLLLTKRAIGLMNQVDMRHRWNTGGEFAVVDEGIDLSSYYPSVEWDLMEVWAKKSNFFYPCCKEPYPDITFHFTVSDYKGVFIATQLNSSRRQVVLSCVAIDGCL